MPAPKIDKDALRKRGSWLEVKRRKEEVAAKVPAFKLVEPDQPRQTYDLAEIIREIPGYDPYDSAGDCVFDVDAAQHAIDFIETQLIHVKGEKARQPFIMERWQQAVIANVFGWKRPDGTRRYRYLFLFLPRKNGKTAWAAAILMYLLFEDGEPGAELLGAASEYTQASFVFQHARGMVMANKALLERCQIFKGQQKSIQLASDFSTYRVIAGVEASVHGTNPSAYVVDELHKITDVDFVDAIETGTGARRQPLGIYITTSDFEREGSVCNEKHDYASKVRDGILNDPAFLPVIYEATIADAWTSPEVWRKANPNIGVSLSEEFLAAQCEKAKGSPRFENTFKRLHLNIRTEQDVRWLPMDKWDACDGSWPESLEGQKCYAGLDMSSTTDITAFVLVFPDCGNAVLPFFWVPGENAYKRAKHDSVPYVEWDKAGLITLTRKESVDHDAVRLAIQKIGELYNIQEIAVDRWNAAQIISQLDDDGFDMVLFGQGYASMSTPSKELEKLVLAGDMLHSGNPVLRWMASNVAVETDAAENIKPSKKKSTERIDGIVALVMALGRAINLDTDDPYSDRGVLTMDTL